MRIGIVALIVGATTLGIPGPYVANARAPETRRAVVSLGERPAPARPVTVTRALPWRANMLGLSWRSDDASAAGVEATIRTRAGGTWSDPIDLHVVPDEGPDDGTEPNLTARVVTEPAWVGTVDAVQVRVEVARGSAPVQDVRVEAINSLGDAEPVPLPVRAARAVGRFLTATPAPAEASASRPPVILRKGWGADESLRSNGPGLASELKMAFVHHTAGDNDYTKDESAGIVRGIYAYHTQANGFSDIGYNFLIDRYGQVFEGRAGGIAQPVIGAHTGGFNTYSTGVALIGNFIGATPPSAMVDSLVKLLSWKLDVHHVPAKGKVKMVAQSDASRYSKGDVVRLARISGHGHASATSCPGARTYDLLPQIRTRVERRGQPKILLPRISTDVLRPDGDGVLDRVRLRADFSRTVDWTWAIQDGSGRAVYEVSGTGEEMREFWYGTEAGDLLVPSGRYPWKLTALRNGRAARPVRGMLRILAPQPTACGSCAGVTADFDGDGADDLAIGVPGEDIGRRADAGGVNVLYGSPDGLTGTGSRFFHEDKIGLDAAEAGDAFGASLATGDFNGDGFADLAVGAPREDRPGAWDAGAVTVLFGSAGGLTVDGAQWFTREDLGGGAHTPVTGDGFGSSLASGDFDGNGKDDLAIGMPATDVRGVADAGMVATLYGTAAGLTVRESPVWHQARAGIWSKPQRADLFGASLAGGDINGDGRDDLVIGVPGETRSGEASAGAVHILYGANGGLTSAGAQRWHQGLAESGDAPEAGDQAGFAVATGDTNGDGRAEVAIGVPGEELGATPDAGAVWVLAGSPGGAVFAAPKIWHADVANVAGDPGLADRFGTALAMGDLSGDGRAELAIGVPGDDIDGVRDAGSVTVLRGSATGLLAVGSRVWHENVSGVRGVAAEGDGFGAALAVGDFDGDGRGDLAIGVPGETVAGAEDAGSVNVLYGGDNGPTTAGDDRWHQNSTGVKNRVEPGDLLGSL